MADCCSAPGLMPLDEAKRQLFNNVCVVSDIEKIAILNADNRVLAADVISPLNVPAHNNSAMDGYALCFDASQTDVAPEKSSFTLIGTAMAGQPFEGELQHGECIRIMTGAVVPDSSNAVEMQENITSSNGVITLNQDAKLGNHIRNAGEDIAKDQLVFSKGHILTSIDIGLLASLGVAKVEVYRKLKVAVFSTGDELKSPGEALTKGDIYESNRHALITMLNRMNVNVLDLGIIVDDLDKIREAFEYADSNADAVISSGGVSVGDADYTKDVLDELGNIQFWKVAMKPGKPFAFGQLPQSVFFGLPGNPVSATVTFHQLTVPALTKMSGATVTEPLLLSAITTHKIKKRAGRMDFQRGIAAIDKSGMLSVSPLSHQGSGVLSSMSAANCFIVLEQDHEGCDAGDAVKVQMFDRIIN